jgi:hypothetical protein
MLVAAAAAQPRKPAAAPAAPLQLDGVWKGQEVNADVGMRHASVTFAKDGGTFAYEDAAGMGVKITMRLQALKVEGALVRFAVPGGGRLRHYSGRWDGRKIAGTIAGDAAGTEPLGTFELSRPVYEASRPLTPDGLAALEAQQRADREPQAPAEPAQAPDAPAPRSEIERKRELGTQRLDQRLGQIAGQAGTLVGRVQEYHATCGAAGTPLYDQPPANDCEGLLREVGRLGVAVGRGLDDAIEEARRSWVEPGTVRRLREEHGLDDNAWDELSSKVRQLEAEWARRKR